MIWHCQTPKRRSCCYTRRSRSLQTCSGSSVLRSLPISLLNLPQTRSVGTLTEFFFLAPQTLRWGAAGKGGEGGATATATWPECNVAYQTSGTSGSLVGLCRKVHLFHPFDEWLFFKTGIFLVGTPSDKQDEIPNYGSTFKALKLWKYSLHPHMFVCFVSSATHRRLWCHRGHCTCAHPKALPSETSLFFVSNSRSNRASVLAKCQGFLSRL